MTFIYIIHFSEVNTDAQPSKHKRKGNIGCSCFANFCGFWDSGVSSVDHITNLQKITIMIYYIVLKRSPGQALTSATLLSDGASMISPDMKDSWKVQMWKSLWVTGKLHWKEEHWQWFLRIHTSHDYLCTSCNVLRCHKMAPKLHFEWQVLVDCCKVSLRW